MICTRKAIIFSNLLQYLLRPYWDRNLVKSFIKGKKISMQQYTANFEFQWGYACWLIEYDTSIPKYYSPRFRYCISIQKPTTSEPVIKYGLHLSWHKGKMYNDKSANTSTTTSPVLIMVTNVFLMTDPRLSPKCQT